MNAIATPPRRVRFGLRTLFVVVTVVCVWLGYSMNWIRQRRAFVRTAANIQQLDTLAPFGLWLFGETSVDIIRLDTDDPAKVERVRRLFPEARILCDTGGPFTTGRYGERKPAD